MTTEPAAPDHTDVPLAVDTVTDVPPELGSPEVLSSATHGFPWVRAAAWVVVFAVLIILPFTMAAFRVEQMCGWIALAIAACGLNILTGYNGQISVGHGALYGVGAYTTALIVTNWQWPLLLATVASAVVCFVVGLLIGLPALRIKGLYLALVTLAVATLFPLAIDQFASFTGGSSGLSLTSPELYRGAVRDRPVRFDPPGGLASDQWKYFIFLAIAALCFLLSRNLIRSRVGRTLVAIRDNDTASEVSGIPVSRVKIIAFGVSAGLAGIGGSIFALNSGRVNPSSFTIAVSIYFLIAVVVGGAASIVGPAIGAVFYGVFIDIITPELPESLKPATPVILGVILILLMLVAPGGIVGLWKVSMHKLAARRARSSAPVT